MQPALQLIDYVVKGAADWSEKQVALNTQKFWKVLGLGTTVSVVREAGNEGLSQ